MSNDDYLEGSPDDEPTSRDRAEAFFRRIADEGALPELAFRAHFLHAVVSGIRQIMGDNGILELLCAIDQQCDWFTEIIAERSDIDNILLEKHGAFDDEMFEKVQETLAWIEYQRAIVQAGKKWLPLAVEEVIKHH
jgi:hypothetical protein